MHMIRIPNYIFYSIYISLIALSAVSCENKNDPTNEIPEALIDSIIFGNPQYSEDYQTVILWARAENATTFFWDFANGTQATGDTVIASYSASGDYWVRCTASGQQNKITDSILVVIPEIDPIEPEFLYKEPQRPFPQHTNYSTNTINPTVDQATMDATVINFYKQWRHRYLKTFNDSMAYVHYTLEYSVGDAISCSEGHGFGMLITVLMAGADSNAYNDFIKLYRWYDYHRSNINPNLMAWQQNKNGQNSNGPDSATDGDLDMAYALLLAHIQWGSDGLVNFLEEAKKMIEAIYSSDISSTYKLIELGDWVSGGNYAKSTRPCDFMLDHLRTFQNITSNIQWAEVIDSTYNIINNIADSVTGLLPDFAIYNEGSFQACPPNFLEGPNDGDYYYNSCRAPWRIATDFIAYGDTTALSELKKLNRWIISSTNNRPSNIKGGYKLDGTPLNSWSDMAFTAPFGVCAMVDNQNQQWLDDMWDQINEESISSGAYFGNSIKILCLITMSGNWWTPTENKN